MLPTFLVIGAAKAGTTSIYHYLRMHPEVFLNAKKETNFFAFENKILDFKNENNELAGINNSSINSYDKYIEEFKKANHKAVGEVSPWYLYFAKESSENIKKYIPNVNLIVILRNPVDRAFSSFSHLIGDGRETRNNFCDALLEEESRIKRNFAPLWHYVTAGFYFEQLLEFYKRFDDSQIKVFLYEDFIRDPDEIVRNLFDFIGVDSSIELPESIHVNKSGVPSNWIGKFLLSKSFSKDALKIVLPNKISERFHTSEIRKKLLDKSLTRIHIKESDRDFLEKIYKDDILALQDLINKDLTHWLS